jgi:hypothetical protein
VATVTKKLFPAEALKPDPNVIVTDGCFSGDNGLFRVASP